MGNLAYDFLASEANYGQYSYDLFGNTPLPEGIHCAVDRPAFLSPSTATSPTTTYVLTSIVQ